MHSTDNRPLQLPQCSLQHNQQNVLWSSTDHLNRAVVLMLRANAQQLSLPCEQSRSCCTQNTEGAPAAQYSSAHLACPLTVVGGCLQGASTSTPEVLKDISGRDTVRTAGTAALWTGATASHFKELEKSWQACSDLSQPQSRCVISCPSDHIHMTGCSRNPQEAQEHCQALILAKTSAHTASLTDNSWSSNF